jgi:predicted HTH transcriptional regulator
MHLPYQIIAPFRGYNRGLILDLSEERAELIKAYKSANPDISNRRIAEIFEVSHFTVNQALK